MSDNRAAEKVLFRGVDRRAMDMYRPFFVPVFSMSRNDTHG